MGKPQYHILTFFDGMLVHPIKYLSVTFFSVSFMYFCDHSPSTEDVTEGLFAMGLLFAKKGKIIPITHGGGTPRLDFF